MGVSWVTLNWWWLMRQLQSHFHSYANSSDLISSLWPPPSTGEWVHEFKKDQIEYVVPCTHRYEGTGRSLSLKLISELRQQSTGQGATGEFIVIATLPLTTPSSRSCSAWDLSLWADTLFSRWPHRVLVTYTPLSRRFLPPSSGQRSPSSSWLSAVSSCH